jgi:hypothetical protein
MGPFKLIDSICHKNKWAPSSSLAASVIINNGPIQTYWHYLLKLKMDPFNFIGCTCHKNKWAHSILLAAPAIKINGPIQAHWQHL